MKARKLLVALLILAVIGWAAYSCTARPNEVEGSASAGSTTSSSSPTGPLTTPRPSPTAELTTPAPPARATEDAAKQGLTVAFTWYPAIDSTQNDAYGRARDWLTDSLAERMIVDASTERGPSVQWARWAEEQAKIIADVSIECSGCPEDTDTVVHRVATIKQTAVSGNGTDTVDPDTTVWVTIVREGDRWLIDEIRY